MLDKFSKRRSASAHVIVLGNEKGGSGKSTVASHVAVGLLKADQRVATIDLDARQQSFTRFINNRRAWAAHTGLDLEVPVHFCIEQGRAMQIGATSPHSLYDPKLASFSMEGYDVTDAIGFIRLYGLPMKVASQRKRW